MARTREQYQLSNKRVLILGGTGSLGTALISAWTGSRRENRILSLSRSERYVVEMRRRFVESAHCVEFQVGDVRDSKCLQRALCTFAPHVVVYAAALKHIDVCERQTRESILTNVLGMQNLAALVGAAPSVECVVYVSTDKACLPINTYGLCKALGERIAVETAAVSDKKFLSVRYGNVLSSSGSVIPLFESQGSGPAAAITLTDPRMTRFFMKMDQCVRLIETAVLHGRSGETWVSPTISMRVQDIAAYFAYRYGKPVAVTGLRLGEKLHETLISADERMRTRVVVSGVGGHLRGYPMRPDETDVDHKKAGGGARRVRQALRALRAAAGWLMGGPPEVPEPVQDPAGKFQQPRETYYVITPAPAKPTLAPPPESGPAEIPAHGYVSDGTVLPPQAAFAFLKSIGAR